MAARMAATEVVRAAAAKAEAGREVVERVEARAAEAKVEAWKVAERACTRN